MQVSEASAKRSEMVRDLPAKLFGLVDELPDVTIHLSNRLQQERRDLRL